MINLNVLLYIYGISITIMLLIINVNNNIDVIFVPNMPLCKENIFWWLVCY